MGIIVIHPTVFLFGAGASSGALSHLEIPPPVDKTFFDIAKLIKSRGTDEIANLVLKSVHSLYGRTFDIALEEYFRDIESRERITKIAPTQRQPKNWLTNRNDLEELIRRVIISTSFDFLKKEPIISDIHKTIFSKMLLAGDSIVTFNYDLLIEEALLDFKSDIWNPFDGYGVKIKYSNTEWSKQWTVSSDSPIKLFKLHGSMNWTTFRNTKIRLKPRPYTVRAKHRDKISILPPGWNKRIDLAPYKHFWKKTRSAMEAANSLVIIGYSLPETDVLSYALFSEVIRLKAKKRYSEIIIVDKNPIVIEKYKGLFRSALRPNSTIRSFDSILNFTDSL